MAPAAANQLFKLQGTEKKSQPHEAKLEVIMPSCFFSETDIINIRCFIGAVSAAAVELDFSAQEAGG